MHCLLRRVLVIVAHPDDETGGCGVLLQRAENPMVLFATDGAPDDHWFWPNFTTRLDYAKARRSEAITALRKARVEAVRFVTDTHPICSDQHLHRALPYALQAVTKAVVEHRADALLTPAYEGGHPDHDSCNFIGSVIGKRFSLPVWEMPLYHRAVSGELVFQQFLSVNGDECVLRPTAPESPRKWDMMKSYESQPALRQMIRSQVERFRPQPAYDYSRPPHPGMLNYEAWQWPMRGSEVSHAFARCLRANLDRAGRQQAHP